MIAGLANHFWQSTLFALAAAVLAAALRRNRASVRHAIWVVASAKWLVPFAWLIIAGRSLAAAFPAASVGASTLQIQPSVSNALRQLAEPFPAVDWLGPMSATAAGGWTIVVLIGLWACGAVAMVATRCRGWLSVRAALRHSTPLTLECLDARLDVRTASGLLEPGVVGIWRPVLLLPAGIDQQLPAVQVESVIAHELCHIRRRDNLTAALHMAVESAFWFHPLVWWIGARLIDERERACDEDVLSRGVRPRDYAEGILRVCQLYVESPIACVSGVTGSNLKRRIEDIMMNRTGHPLSMTRSILVTMAAACAVVAPIVSGAMTPMHAQSAAPAQAMAPQSSAPAALSSVIKVMMDAGATTTDRDRLIGKAYAGIVSVQAVRLPQGAAVASVVAVPSDSTGTQTIGLRFAIAADDPKLQLLRKGRDIRVRGTLTGFSTDQRVLWADFSDLVIEDGGSR